MSVSIRLTSWGARRIVVPWGVVADPPNINYPTENILSYAHFHITDSRLPSVIFNGSIYSSSSDWSEGLPPLLTDILREYSVDELVLQPGTVRFLSFLTNVVKIRSIKCPDLNTYKTRLNTLLGEEANNMSVTLNVKALGVEREEDDAPSYHFLYFYISNSAFPDVEFYSHFKASSIRELNELIKELIAEYSITNLLIDTDVIDGRLTELYFCFLPSNITKLSHKSLSEYKNLVSNLTS